MPVLLHSQPLFEQRRQRLEANPLERTISVVLGNLLVDDARRLRGEGLAATTASSEARLNRLMTTTGLRFSEWTALSAGRPSKLQSEMRRGPAAAPFFSSTSLLVLHKSDQPLVQPVELLNASFMVRRDEPVMWPAPHSGFTKYQATLLKEGLHRDPSSSVASVTAYRILPATEGLAARWAQGRDPITWCFNPRAAEFDRGTRRQAPGVEGGTCRSSDGAALQMGSCFVTTCSCGRCRACGWGHSRPPNRASVRALVVGRSSVWARRQPCTSRALFVPLLD